MRKDRMHMHIHVLWSMHRAEPGVLTPLVLWPHSKETGGRTQLCQLPTFEWKNNKNQRRPRERMQSFIITQFPCLKCVPCAYATRTKRKECVFAQRTFALQHKYFQTHNVSLYRWNGRLSTAIFWRWHPRNEHRIADPNGNWEQRWQTKNMPKS